MHVEFLSHWSGELGREMPLNRYGHDGMPIVVFPSSGGSHNEYADFGMIEACQEFILKGKVQFFTLSTNDYDSWLNHSKLPHDRALAHQAYENYVINEAVPFIKHKTWRNGPMMTTGCSMGAYHALNFLLKHPDVFQKTVALSGVYDARFFVGEYDGDELIYQNSPADYIWKLDDPWFLNQIRTADIVICTGLGAWEHDGLPSYNILRDAFAEKEIDAWFDEWGYDVTHDWEWWRQQMPYYLHQIFH